MKRVRLRMFDRLRMPGRPLNDDFVDLRRLTQAEVQPALPLRSVAVAAGHDLHLLLAVPEQPHLGADGAAVRRRPFQLKLDPVIARRDRVFVNEQRPVLIGDDHVLHAAIPQVGRRDRPAVVLVAGRRRRPPLPRISPPLLSQTCFG